jgi:hypothetical protein
MRLIELKILSVLCSAFVLYNPNNGQLVVFRRFNPEDNALKILT